MPLPKASDVSRDYVKQTQLTREQRKKRIEQWINDNLVSKLKTYIPNVDIMNNTVEGFLIHEAPSDYYGVNQAEWKEFFEEIIKPLGYEPVYTWEGGGMYDMVGIKWKTKICLLSDQ